MTDPFEEVRAGLNRLLSDLPRLPSSLRVQSQDVLIELAWDTIPSASPAPSSNESPPSPETIAQPDANLLHVTAPMVGVFYRGPEPGAAPFIDIGSIVEPGDQVAIVEAMKLFLPIEADNRGRVTAVLVEDGGSVQYGDPLIALELIEA